MPTARIDPGLSIGTVALTVADLERSIAFYRDALEFQVQTREDASARMGASADRTTPALLDLHEVPGARHPRRATGLYHFAVLLPKRAELARAILRLSDVGVRIHGASDHGVSEAIYLSDPDGNGIEIYRDRPPEEWPRDREGAIRMPTDPFDLDGILRTVPRSEDRKAAPPGGHGAKAAPPGGHGRNRAPADTRIGHVHLHVANLEAAERFYVDVLGFDVTTRYGSEALFVSAGGYHHHIGLNTWAGVGAPSPPDGSVGLRWFELAHTNEGERDKTASRARESGVESERVGSDYLIRDPSRNRIRLTVAFKTADRANAAS